MITKSRRPSLASLSGVMPLEWSGSVGSEAPYIVSCGARKTSGARLKMR